MDEVPGLDAGHHRDGRFDEVLPIGPPDDSAREALWRRATPQVAQATEATLATGTRVRAGTDDHLDAVRATRPTLDRADVERQEDIERFRRA